MCGIVGYSGHRKAINVLLNGLRMLEYRGYDSAGVTVKQGGELVTIKTQGKITDLTSLVLESGVRFDGTVGIGHTRWATHGEVNSVNAHPHFTDRVSIVHNGIIENFRELDEFLREKGIHKRSQTDTETICLLVDYFLGECNFDEAFRKAIGMLRGSFAICAVSTLSGSMALAKNETPLIVGLGDGEFFIASDVTAMIEYTNRFVFLEDGDIAFINGGLNVFNDGPVDREIKVIDWSVDVAKKSGFKHFMIKEIAEESEAVRNTIQPRINGVGRLLIGEEISAGPDFLSSLEKITLVACGTSYYAALVSKPIIEKYARVPVDVEIGSEFRYKEPIFTERELFVAISQSGETADTKESLKFAKRMGVRTLSVVNVKNSEIARISDDCLYTFAGPEISVASTKAFVSQLAVLYMLAFYIASLRGLDVGEMIESLIGIPDLIGSTFNMVRERVEFLSRKYAHYTDFMYLGRGLMYSIALEGALKLKEISYIHAEAYPAGEIKHGPIALIDELTPTLVLAPYFEPYYSKTISNASEVKTRMGKILLVSDKPSGVEDDIIPMVNIDYDFTPFIYIVPLQLFAYYIALFLGNDIDQPRNLAKSVTVE